MYTKLKTENFETSNPQDIITVFIGGRVAGVNGTYAAEPLYQTNFEKTQTGEVPERFPRARRRLRGEAGRGQQISRVARSTSRCVRLHVWPVSPPRQRNQCTDVRHKKRPPLPGVRHRVERRQRLPTAGRPGQAGDRVAQGQCRRGQGAVSLGAAASGFDWR